MSNFLSISIDDLIALKSIKNTFGDDVLHTPNLDRLADMGVSFENAFAQVALCNPSRASILSSQRPEKTGIHANLAVWYESIDPAETLPVLLAENGYETSVLGKVYHGYVGTLKTVPGLENVGLFADKTGWNGSEHPFRSGVLSIAEEEHGDYINTSAAIDRIEAWGDSGNNAVFLGLYRPHKDWTVPQFYFDLYPLDEITLPLHAADDRQDLPAYVQSLLSDWIHEDILEADVWKPEVQAYFASISFADAQIGRVLDALEQGGHLADTTIMLWSDHGYHLGDKEKWHKFTLWEEAARAPLMIYDPEATVAGVKIKTPVELLDILPTAVDLLGVTPSWETQGKSLTDMLDGSTPDAAGQAITTWYGSASLRTNDYRYIRYEDGSEEFYDLKIDPREETNLANSADYDEERVEHLQTLLEALSEGGWRYVDGSADFSGETNDLHVVLQTEESLVLGGRGDDQYFFPRTGPARIVEEADGGEDTVYFSKSFVMPDNVENAIARNKAPGLKQVEGNASDNSIINANRAYGHGGNDLLQLRKTFAKFADGGSGDDTIIGSLKDDELLGGTGQDTIFARSGNDLILPGFGQDVVFGANGLDTVQLPVSTSEVSGLSRGPNGGDLVHYGGANDVELVSVERIIDSLGVEVDLSGLPLPSPSGDTLIRWNAGTRIVAAVDGGPDWTPHAGVLTGGPSQVAGGIAWSLASGVPTAAVPLELYNQRRWDPDSGAEMALEFGDGELADGGYTVRLYLGSTAWVGTDQPGDRVFDILIEDEIVFDNFDPVAAFGHQVGGLLEWQGNVSDGTVNIDFRHILGANHPNIHAVEILGGANIPPEAVDDEIADELPGTSLFLDVLTNDSDPDGDDFVIVSVTQGTAGEVLIQSEGTELLYLRDTGITGLFPGDQFTYTIADTSGAEATATVTIAAETADAGAPVFDPLPRPVVSELSTLSVSFSASDPDGNDTLALDAFLFRPNGEPGNPSRFEVTDNGDGTALFTWETPQRNVDGIYWVQVTADDGNNPTVMDSFEITVLDSSSPGSGAPVFDALPDQTAPEQTMVSIPFSASDPDGNDTFMLDAFLFRPNGQAANELRYIVTDYNDGTAEFTWNTPSRNFDGVYRLEVSADDGSNATVTDSFEITVFDVV